MTEPTILDSCSQDEFFGNFSLIEQNTTDELDVVMKRFWFLLEGYPETTPEALKLKDYNKARNMFLMEPIDVVSLLKKADVLFKQFESSPYGQYNSFTKLQQAFFDLMQKAESAILLSEDHCDFTVFIKTSVGYACFSWMDPA